MNDNANDPEALYQRYKQKRSNSDTPVISKRDDTDNSEEALVDRLYSQYRQTRRSTDTEVDKIMQLIAADKTGDEQSHSTQSTASNNPNPHIKPVALQPENNITATTRESTSTQAKNDSRYMLKYVVPAIAATLFVFFALPIINKTDNTTDSTSQMAFLTTDLAPFIEPVESSILGFANTDNDNSTAIRYGMLSADLQVLRKTTASADSIKQVVKSYLLSERANTESIVATAQSVVSSISSGNDTPDNQAISNIETLIKALADHTVQRNTFEWYNIGRATESIILAAQQALSTSDTLLLRSALLHGNSLTVPDTDPSLQSQIHSLFSSTIEESMAPAAIRDILSKAQDIKSVVQ